jgi:hypothetical protein
LRAVPRGDRRARIAAIVDALPVQRARRRLRRAYHFAAQFAFFAITQIGEGSSALRRRRVRRRVGRRARGFLRRARGHARQAALLDFVLALAWAVAFSPGAESPRRSLFREGVVALRRRSRTPFAFRYRPPPLTAASH